MIRKTITILSLLGLLLSIGLWGMSYLNLFYIGTHHYINTWGGYVLYDYRSSPIPWPSTDLGWSFGAFDPSTKDNNKDRREGEDTFLRQTILWPRFRCSKQMMWIAVPLWMPTFLFASLCFAYLYLPTHRRSKCKKLGLCVKCGYNLRGLTEPRCPECNTLFEERLLKKDT